MESLLSEKFRGDLRVTEARRLIKEALLEHQGGIHGVRGPLKGYQEHMPTLLERLSHIRARPPALPYLGSGFGRGSLVELMDGSIKYDFISGIGVHYLGHSHPELVEACVEAALRDTVMQGNLQQNQEALTFSERLLGMANEDGARLEHVFLTTSGAMANENALKIAFHKRFPADRLLAFTGGFAGRSLALCHITDRPVYREGLPQTVLVDYVPFFDPEHPEESRESALAVLKGHLRRYPRRHAAMIFELVQGEGGFYPGDRSFFGSLMGCLQEEGIAVIVDEIQTFGRTWRPFAFQHFDLSGFVDIVTVGKLTQACATLFRPQYRPSPELVSQTFAASTSALLAGLAILEELNQGGYFGPQGRIARIHERFRFHLEGIASRHGGWIRGPFGIGAMVAFTPFDGTRERVKALLDVLFEEGVIAFMAGHDPYRIRFLIPAGAVTMEDIDAVARILERSLERVAKG